MGSEKRFVNYMKTGKIFVDSLSIIINVLPFVIII